jgi:inward rectifier potassium channel
VIVNNNKKGEELKDSGFSNVPRNGGIRLINKDGSSNVKKEGLGFKDRFSLFHALVSMQWFSFFLCLFAGFVLLNILFASVYVTLGIEGITNVESMKETPDFLRAIYFSAQSLTTVGYGHMSPQNNITSIIAAFESFIGLLAFAMATGLLYGRFSKPKASIIFSDNALISPYKGGKAIMIRLANPKNSQIIDVQAEMFVSYLEKTDNGAVRRFYTLGLEISRINILATSWTIVHSLEKDSPLGQLKKEDLQDADAELMVQIQGFDVTYNQPVNTRTSFKSTEVIWDAKFSIILGNNDEGRATINLGKLSDYKKV